MDCRIMGAEAAYRKITAEPDIASRLGQLRDNYVVWDTIPHTPRVCLKVPTGGGKTIIAAHALKIVSETWLSREFPVVLWFTPSDTIRKQTSEALKKPRHPYREVIDEQFGGKVRVFDLDEKFNIRPTDFEQNTVIIVATSQSFVKEETTKYNVYRTNENYESHFAHIKATDTMEKDEDGKVKLSFANLMHFYRPIMIVDEAHKMLTKLTQTSFQRINPSAIIELTATPIDDKVEKINNVLYSVRASELKEEEMIKLPIALKEHYGWETAVDEAIAKRAELEKAASNESDYIRPIILFQAQDKNGEVNVEALKKYLLETSNLPESEIAIATGEQKELDGIDIFARDCAIRYIITVEALKEGWDCSFAYILCSLANVRSNTAVEQLLGRVMRMPYAKTRKTAALNKAYAYVLSRSFGESAVALVEKLKKKGFDEEEAKSVIEVQTSLFENEVFEINKVKLDSPVITIPSSIVLDTKTSIIEFTKQTSDADIQRVCEQVTEPEAYEIKRKFACYKKREEEQSPAKAGEHFSIPRLMTEIQGELEFADTEIIFENSDWDIAKFASAKLEAGEFKIEPQGHGFVIDIDGHKLRFSAAGENQMELPYIDIENWQPANLISWLDKTLKQIDIPQGQMVNWLRQAVEYLTEVRGLKLTELMLAKYVLAKKLESKIADARLKAKKTAYQTFLFDERTARVELDFDNGFAFDANIYDNELYYNGSFRFTKHYLGANKVPAIDGGQNGEEFQCAIAIDSLPEVKYWLRNVARNPASFWLPTATDKFYPDFVSLLNDGRILVVEYKGAQFRGTPDVKEKELIGALWEKHTQGKGLFLMAWKTEQGLTTAEQIKKKIMK
ncbi:type III restriction endonuclease [Bacteroidia bacterium]|nr:type III restriction endonuclease [Bacteroidia bacterium]